MSRHIAPDAPTVLFVERDQDDRTMYVEYVRLCGWHAIEVANTTEALTEALAADVIVTGLCVEGAFDGVELVQRLRALPATRDTPILVLTACAFDRDCQRALAAGCDAFLAKPCLPDRLLGEMRAALARHVPKAQPARARGVSHRRRQAS